MRPESASPAASPGGPVDIGTLWEAAVRDRDRSPFLTFITRPGDSNTWSYRQFGQLVRLTADRLRAAGAAPGRTVHLDLHNSPAFIMCWLACASLGAVAVGCEPEAEVPELVDQLDRTRPVLGVVGLDRRWTYRNAVSRSTVPELTVIELTEDEPDTLAGSPLLGGTAPTTAAEGPGAGAGSHEMPPDALCAFFTSPAHAALPAAAPPPNSPTAAPPPARSDGRVLTHAACAAIAREHATTHGLDPNSRWFITGDLHDPATLAAELTAVITAGAAAILAARFSPDTWIDQTERFGATHTRFSAGRLSALVDATARGGAPARGAEPARRDDDPERGDAGAGTAGLVTDVPRASTLESVIVGPGAADAAFDRFAKLTGVRPVVASGTVIAAAGLLALSSSSEDIPANAGTPV